jgi:CheY-like chemotaxis protein
MPFEPKALTACYIHMPELDGFQVVQALREQERSTGGHLPVIALTARSRKEDRQQCLAAGMDDYLSKPIRAADLLAAIYRIASAHGTAAPSPRFTPCPSSRAFPLGSLIASWRGNRFSL